jgi:hypothetical protein
VHFEVGFSVVNNQPALLYFYQGELISCQLFTFSNGAISKVFTIRNPDKLQHLKK